MTTPHVRPLSVTPDSFETQVLDASERQPVLVDFSAVWCPPCALVSSILAEVAAERADTAVIATVDIDAHPQLAERFAIRTLPTLLLFRDREVVDSLVGLHGKEQILRRLDAAAPELLSA